jgi:hypothetical protein
MTAHLLVYEPLDAPPSDPRHLLQQQAVVAAARVTLARGHTLLAPADPDLLPLLAPAARDYAGVFEGPGGRRDGPPIGLYGLDLEPQDEEAPRHLMRRADWFGDVHHLPRAVALLDVPVAFVVADLLQVARDLVQLKTALRADGHEIAGRLRKIVYLSALSSRDRGLLDLLPPDLFPLRPIAADDLLRARLERVARTPEIDWIGSRREEGEREPFIAFGVAFELALAEAGFPA